ncbi:MAG: LicD family protein [Prevotella sp.]|nr:LicD family protein [Prevotella sp.]
MANYDLRRLQLRLLDILIEIDRVCREHGLRYYLMYGTMLGAVRHKGFIPWDDDIDIGMPRDEYETLMAHAAEWLPGHLQMVCAENDEHYPVAFAKIQDRTTTLIERKHYRYLGGIYCDVMPIDGIPAGHLRQKWQILRYRFWSRMLYLVHRDPYRHGHGPSSWLPLLARKCTSLKSVQQHIRKTLTRYRGKDCTHVCLFGDHTHIVIPREVMGKPKEVAFEGHLFWGPEQADDYLKYCFGSTYMQLPPEEKRHVHNFYYLDFDHPFADYQA